MTAVEPTPSDRPTSAESNTSLVPENALFVIVGNGAGTGGLARRTVAYLRDSGYPFAFNNDAVELATRTAVLFQAGFDGEARRLARLIGLAPTRVQPHPDEQLVTDASGYRLLLLLGSDWADVTTLEDDIPDEVPASDDAQPSELGRERTFVAPPNRCCV
jgi:hypothetical protein